VLAGHSQGAQLSLYLAKVRHSVAGVASIGGGVLRTVGRREFPDFVYDARLTPATRFRAFHHATDVDDFRRSVYRALGMPDSNVRTTSDSTTGCRDNPHSCVVVDRLIPMTGAIPAFLEEWQWVTSPPG
jgi:hypothetical protein